MQQELPEHHIQRTILSDLLTADSKRYRDLKPKDIESNLFLYHMKELIRMQLVQKRSSGVYSLSRKGRQLADRSSLGTFKLRLQPKLISVLVLKNRDGRYILINRTHVPFLGFTGFPSGKIHFGESLHGAAKRELAEKTGLEIEIKLRGNLHMRFLDRLTHEVVFDTIAYVHVGEVDVDKHRFEGDYFYTYLGSKDDLFVDKSFKGHREILNFLKTHQDTYFIEEIEHDSDF